jgi:hypothetical protein
MFEGTPYVHFRAVMFMLCVGMWLFITPYPQVMPMNTTTHIPWRRDVHNDRLWGYYGNKVNVCVNGDILISI